MIVLNGLPHEGEVIAGRYRVDELLGQGGMGAVFRATQLGLMRAVALKVLLPERTGVRVRERFEREARVAAAMHHDGVVDVYDFGVDEHDRLYLVMELLIGRSLSHRIADGPVSEEEASEVVAQVAAALDAAHAVGLVHRDIKPDNIFCVDTGDGGQKIKVVDFGLAFIRDGGDLGRLTSESVVSGTPDYMAPEQCRGQRDLDGAVDVYALGCVLMELLTGQPPFAGQQGELLAQHLHVPAPRVSTRRPQVSPGLSALVEQMLDKQADRRPTAAAVVQGLRGVAAHQEGQARKGADRLARAIAPKVGPGSTAVDANAHDDATTEIVTERPVVVVRGPNQAGLSIALGVNGFAVVEQADEDSDDDGAGTVEIMLRGTPAQVGRRQQAGATVIAGADPEDLEALTALVTAGAAEVVSLPVNLEELAHKVVRAHKRAARVQRKESA